MNNPIYSLFDEFARFIIPVLVMQLRFSAILFAIIYPITRLMKKRSPHWRLGLWALLLIRLLLPTDLSFTLSGRNLMQFPLTRMYHYVTSFWRETIPQNDFSINFDDSDGYNHLQDSVGNAQPGTVSRESRLPWQSIALWFWGGGMLFFSLVFLRQRYRYHAVVQRAQPVTDSLVNAMAQTWCTHFKIRRQVRMLTSECIPSPFTLGSIRPAIVLPQNLIKRDQKDLLNLIIAHEMAHIKRFDDVWIKLQNLIQIIYFFNPFVWIANNRINLSRECICDSMVVSSRKMSARAYGTGLMSVLKLNLSGSSGYGWLPGFGSERKRLITRISHLKGARSMKKVDFLLLYASLLILGIVLLPMAGCDRVQNPESEKEMQENASLLRSNTLPEFVSPLQSAQRITSRFGKQHDPFTDRSFFHNGIDIAAEIGTEVFAIADGKVIQAVSDYEENNGYGKNIILMHSNGFQSRYCHLDSVLVAAGQLVEAGEPVGTVGTTGRSTAPHLHLEIRVNDELKDPQEFIDFTTIQAQPEQSANAALQSFEPVLPLHHGVVTAKFGSMKHPFTGKIVSHTGIDIAAPKDTDVFAAEKGIVKLADSNYTPNQGPGKQIIVQHSDAIQTRYTHLDTIYVKQDQAVEAGQLIGAVGSTGLSTGPHLHFEVRINNEAQNPQKYLDFKGLKKVKR
ncbi:peptidoglycan DD-metalloendopeptidase family protein [candidate division KSB1 bacterium]|nr:peptidoglycan DD-metalloendopeptidase family protein [candidate division KSB1 bacterium]